LRDDPIIRKWPQVIPVFCHQRPVITSKQGKNKTPKEKRKKDHTEELRSNLNEDNSHMNVQGPSTAAWQALTTYHNIPTDFLGSPMRCRLISNINQQSEFLSKDWQ